jgi:hypothetical protein
MTKAHFVSHAGDDHKEHDNEEGEKFYRTSHSGRLKATKIALSYIKRKGREPFKMYCLDATMILLQRKEKRLETDDCYSFLGNIISSPTLS